MVPNRLIDIGPHTHTLNTVNCRSTGHPSTEHSITGETRQRQWMDKSKGPMEALKNRQFYPIQNESIRRRLLTLNIMRVAAIFGCYFRYYYRRRRFCIHTHHQHLWCTKLSVRRSPKAIESFSLPTSHHRQLLFKYCSTVLLCTGRFLLIGPLIKVIAKRTVRERLRLNWTVLKNRHATKKKERIKRRI